MTISVEGLLTMTKDTTMAVDVFEIPPDLVIIIISGYLNLYIPF